MNKGFLRVLVNGEDQVVYKHREVYISASLVVQVEKRCRSIFDEWPVPIRDLHKYLVKNGVLAVCKHDSDTGDIGELEDCLDELPLYTIKTANDENYILHPYEHERMERFLAGTEDPMYDLVHELRYNPNIKLSSEVQEAESHFKKHKSE